MVQMTGGQALVRSLYREGVRTVFGLPGVQTYHAVDAFHDENGVQFITTRHEQATTYMAYGYARASGRVGTALVVPGPGVQNASAGLGTAYAASSPVFLISGQVNLDKIGKNVGVLHEVDGQLDTVKPITKWRAQVLKAAEIPRAVHTAFQHLRTGRPRPVNIEIPPETFAEVADVELYEPEEYPPPSGNQRDLEQAVRLLSQASRPVIYAGGGAISSGASSILQAVAEFLQAPVITTGEGKGAVSARHYLSFDTLRRTGDPIREFFETCDVVLAVGTRFAEAPALPHQQVIQIDIDPEEIGRNHAKTLGIVGDAGATLDRLHHLLQQAMRSRPSEKTRFEAIRQQRLDQAGLTQPQGGFVQAIRENLPDDAIVVPDMTQVGYYSRSFFPVYEPGTYVTSSYYGNLGFAYPTALGAKVARPERTVISISGDGGFLFNAQELATAVLYGINVVAIVFSDNAYGNVLRDQEDRFKGHVIGSRLYNPDFTKLAEAFGVDGIRASGPADLGAALRQAIAKDRPALIEVPVGKMPYPY